MSDDPGYRFRNYADFYEQGEVDGYVDLILDMLRLDGPEYAGVDLSAHRAALAGMIVAARMRFLDEDDDMRRRAAEEGSAERPHRRLEKNWNDDEPEPTHDYSEWWSPDQADEEWRELWDETFGKKRSLLTGETARNPGWFRAPGHGGSRLMKSPLVSIYLLVNGFFRSVLRVPFFPIFKANDHAVSDITAIPHLNPAARLFLLIGQAVDDRYTREQCKRVHDDCYHLLGPEGRRISHHRP